MTENRRIFWNIVATYGRSLYALCVGLVTARWALIALGHVDYGLMGVVSGLTAFVSFFNGLLAAAIGRFYAFSIGRALIVGNQENGVEECRQWFSVALLVHLALPTILIVIGYPAGEWVVKHFLTIPPDRVAACVWVWRFVCITCYIGMVTIPLNAMYGAHQYIAELTIYSFVTTSLNALFLYYMITHPGIWLTKYAFWQMLLALLPQTIIAIRAIYLFPECRFRLKYCWDVDKFKQIFNYAFWQFFGNLGGLVRNQGIAVLVNKYFGPALNATISLGNSVASHTETLSAALYGAFSPAITNKAGAGDIKQMLRLSYRASKFGTALCLPFAIPLLIELPYITKLWLGNPPPMLVDVCRWSIVYILLGLMLRGVDLAVLSMGRVALYSFVLGGFMILSFPANWLLIHMGVSGFISVCYVLVTFRALGALISIPIARRLVSFSGRYFVVRIFIPIIIASCLTLLIASIPSFFMNCGIVRTIVTALLSEVVLLPLLWSILLDHDERIYVKSKLAFIKMKVNK